MEKPETPFNLDSFIRQRAEEQRHQSLAPIQSTPPQESTDPKPAADTVPAPSQDTPDKEPTPQQKLHRPTEEPVSSSAHTGYGRATATKQQHITENATDYLNQSAESAAESHKVAQQAVHHFQEEKSNGQVRLATEAAQEAAQASLEAMEFAHEATRSAIHEAQQGRAQQSIYSTHKLLITLNLLLFVAAAGALYLFGWPNIATQPPPPVTNSVMDSALTQSLTQQLLDEQEKRLRREQELALMEQSLSRLQQQQSTLESNLNQTQSALSSEREKIQANDTQMQTFSLMEQDLKKRIAELEKRLEEKIVQAIPSAPSHPTVTAAVPSTAASTIVAPVGPVHLQKPANHTLQDSGREKEVDEILQKLYSLHSELSEQKQSAPYSYNRK